MRLPRKVTLFAAAVGVLIVAAVGGLLLRPPLPLIMEAGLRSTIDQPKRRWR